MVDLIQRYTLAFTGSPQDEFASEDKHVRKRRLGPRTHGGSSPEGHNPSPDLRLQAASKSVPCDHQGPYGVSLYSRSS
jgi:hypothetical protein